MKTLLGFLGLGFIWMACAAHVGAQDTKAQPEFTVASMKLNTAGGTSGTKTGHGQLSAGNSSLHDLLKVAYKVKDYQIKGPSWIDDAHYDIEAKADPEVDNPTLALMLQSLLRQRIGLVIQRDTRDVAGYGLVVAKSGAKLAPTDLPTGARTGVADSKLTAKGVNMGQLADQLSRWVDKPVFDKTQMTGRFDLVLEAAEFKGGSASPDPEGGPSLFTALPDQLGLRLESGKFPVETIIVVSGNKMPTEN